MSFETALLMQKKSNYRRAIQLYQEIVQIDPCHCRAQGGLALSLAALQEYERAKCAAVQALALNKNCDYAHLALALICHAQHEKEQFVDEVERAFYVKPFVFDIASKYAQFLADEKEVTSALPVFQRMIEADEARECRHYLYALALYQLRKPKLAVQQSLVALRRDPSFETFCLLIRAVFGLMPFV